MIETTYALHTMAPHLTPYASHALTTAHGLVSHISAMPNDPNPPPAAATSSTNSSGSATT